MPAMSSDAVSDLSQFRVTLFVGPQALEAEPFTFSTVFNVKKRSWKGGVQVAVELRRDQIEAGRAAIRFNLWVTKSLAALPAEERSSQESRAQELLIEALSRCKLDLLLLAGIAQENQRLKADAWAQQFDSTVTARAEFITSYVATELDLPQTESSSP